MSEQKAFLEKIHIKNYRSLRNITFPLKPLTVFVGPNASGKSNTLNALRLLNSMLRFETPPADANFLRDRLWVGGADHITCELHAKVQKTPVQYKLVFKAKDENLSIDEELSVNDVKVISIQNGKGEVKDENGENITTYESNRLALRSAGDYGYRPVTKALTKFIQGWEVYDFQPDHIRTHPNRFSTITKNIQESLKLNSYGVNVPNILWDWHERKPENFHYVREALEASINIGIDYQVINGENQLCLLEGV